MIFKPKKESIGTICFLTYNRGNLLLKTIKELMPQIRASWPILIVDNASSRYLEEYEEIKSLATNSESLFYYRHKENGLFEGILSS